MFQQKDRNQQKRLDLAGRRIVEASRLSEAEVNNIAESPFLYARVRARVANESEKQEVTIWSNLSLASSKAIPAMALAAAVSLGLFVYVNWNKSANPAFSVDAYLGAGDSGIDNFVIAERRMTGEEVLTTIISRDEREAVK